MVTIGKEDFCVRLPTPLWKPCAIVFRADALPSRVHGVAMIQRMKLQQGRNSGQPWTRADGGPRLGDLFGVVRNRWRAGQPPWHRFKEDPEPRPTIFASASQTRQRSTDLTPLPSAVYHPATRQYFRRFAEKLARMCSRSHSRCAGLPRHLAKTGTDDPAVAVPYRKHQAPPL
jgi:hypothetical protein